MATKTFEELKQLAIQIRDEKTNKQNTATRIGTQMLEHLNKLEQDYYDKTATDEELKQRDEKLTELSSNNAQIILDNSNIDTDNVSVVGDAVIPDFNTKNGYYKTNGEFIEDDNFITKIFVVEPFKYYLINCPLFGSSITSNIAFLDTNDRIIGCDRRDIVNLLIKSGGATKISLSGTIASENKITVQVYKSVINNIASGSVTGDKIASYAVTGDKIASGSVTGDKIASYAVTGDKIASGSITEDKVSFANSKNVFNPHDKNVMIGYYQADKEPIESSSFNLTGYMPVKPTQKYVSSKDGVLVSPRFVTFFDKDLVIQSYISGSDGTTNVIQIPENSVYVRISVQTTNWENFQFEEGDSPTAYEPYRVLINKDMLPKSDLDDITFTDTEFVGKNILSPDKIIKGGNQYINSNKGSVATSPVGAYGYTDYIPIDERGLVITGGNVKGTVIGHAVYDVNKQYLSFASKV